MSFTNSIVTLRKMIKQIPQTTQHLTNDELTVQNDIIFKLNQTATAPKVKINYQETLHKLLKYNEFKPSPAQLEHISKQLEQLCNQDNLSEEDVQKIIDQYYWREEEKEVDLTIQRKLKLKCWVFQPAFDRFAEEPLFLQIEYG